MKYYLTFICCCSLVTAKAQQASYLSVSLLSPVFYGETSLGLEHFSKSHFSYGATAGYMQRVIGSYKGAGFRNEDRRGMKGAFLAFNTKYYSTNPTDSPPVNFYAGLNLIASFSQLSNVYFTATDDYYLCGFNLGTGLRFNLSKQFSIETGVTIPCMALSKTAFPFRNEYYPGIGNATQQQNKQFSNANRFASFSLNLAIKLN